MDLTDAQKRDKRFYNADSVLVFNRPRCRFQGRRCRKIAAASPTNICLSKPATASGLCRSKIWNASRSASRKNFLCPAGDRLQLKANGQCQDGRKLANGELVTVKQIHPDGRIALNDGRTLPKNYRQFVRGYAVTSYAAQGKTVDYVLFSDSAVAAATNEQQWYVTISRGRKGVKIFTADKIQLRQNITHSGDRTLALDMAPKVRFTSWRRFGGAMSPMFSMFNIRNASPPNGGHETIAAR